MKSKKQNGDDAITAIIIGVIGWGLVFAVDWILTLFGKGFL